MSKIRNNSKNSGFALFEAMIALLVISVGILGISKLQTVVIKGAASARSHAEAMALAQAKIEELRNTVSASQHYSNTSGCTTGSIVKSGTDNSTGVNAVYARKWTITPSCSPTIQHLIKVTVSWTDADGAQNVTLNSLIAWNDPAKNALDLTTGDASGGVGPGGNATLGDMDMDYETLPVGATSNGADGSYTYNPQTGQYELIIADEDEVGYRVALYSKVPIIKLSGIIALDRDSTTRATTSISNIVVYRTDITYCFYPLKFTDATDSLTFGAGGASTSTDTAAAYTCYVPQGWYGSVGLYQRSTDTATACTTTYGLFNGNTSVYAADNKTKCTMTGDYACPQLKENSFDLIGQRTHKVLIYKDAADLAARNDDSAVGQTGVMTGHQNMLIPNYDSMARLERMDFFIYAPVRGRFESCLERFPDEYTFATGASPAAYSIGRLNNAGQSNTVLGAIGVPSIVYSNYVIDGYIKDQTGGFVTLSGVATGSCTSVIAYGTSPSGNFYCPVSSGQYQCEVSYGWSGNIAGQSFNDVTADTVQDITCPP